MSVAKVVEISGNFSVATSNVLATRTHFRA